jgi:hypothetical protein
MTSIILAATILVLAKAAIMYQRNLTGNVINSKRIKAPTTIVSVLPTVVQLSGCGDVVDFSKLSIGQLQSLGGIFRYLQDSLEAEKTFVVVVGPH